MARLRLKLFADRCYCIVNDANQNEICLLQEWGEWITGDRRVDELGGALPAFFAAVPQADQIVIGSAERAGQPNSDGAGADDENRPLVRAAHCATPEAQRFEALRFLRTLVVPGFADSKPTPPSGEAEIRTTAPEPMAPLRMRSAKGASMCRWIV